MPDIRFSTAAQSLQKHQQAVCTALFLLLAWIVPDSLASSVIGGFVVLALLPVLKELVRLSGDNVDKLSTAQKVYLQAFAKTPRAQTIAIVAVSACLLRAMKLFSLESPSPGFQTFYSLQQFSLDWILLPPLLYLAASFISIASRLKARTTKLDPNLSGQRQVWSAASYGLFLLAFALSIVSVVSAHTGPVTWLANWLIASARDANLAGMSLFSAPQVILLPDSTHVIPPQEIAFIAGVQWAAGIALFLLLLPQALKLAGFLTSVCWRVVSASPSSLVEAFIETLHLPGHALLFREKHPRLMNMARSFWWLTACYLCLFYLVGFAGGPLGQTILNWLDFSTVDANFYKWGDGVRDFVPVSNHANLRIFLASVVALYGTVPMAVMSSVFLPFKKPRKLVINADGISLPDGPYASLWFRPFRLWHDLKSVSIRNAKKLKDPSKAVFVLKFRSGGALHIAASQLLVKDLEVLINTIDEHAASCAVQPDVIATVISLLRLDKDAVSSDGTVDVGSRMIAAQEFKSTVFVPLARGDWLADKRARIIRQLATKPLCAVYLARLESGNLAVVKQFYLAQDNEETRAMSKVFQRENELLRELDHPGISKVIDSYSEGSSTFLVIEHRPGTDLRSFVAEHGPRSEGVAVAWAKQLSEIMIYLHGRDPVILHRDLTPDNIVVGEDGQMRVIDFGAARQFLDGITGTMIGKQCYMAPEQIRGQAGPRSDVYAFGCTLNFLLTGAEPVALTQSSPATACDVSRELDQLIRDCTESDEERSPPVSLKFWRV